MVPPARREPTGPVRAPSPALEPVEPLDDGIEAAGERSPARVLGRRVVVAASRLTGIDEGGSDRRGEDAQRGDRQEHHDAADEPADAFGGGDVAIADGRDRLQDVPQRGRELRVLLAVRSQITKAPRNAEAGPR